MDMEPNFQEFEFESKQKWDSISSPSFDDNKNGFDCNICLDSATEPVVTLCGHLYCWPCIYKWLHVQTTSTESTEPPTCPICKTYISVSSLVPLYGRGTTTAPPDSNAKSPTIPRRPQAHHAMEQNPHHHLPFRYREEEDYQNYRNSHGMGNLMTSLLSPTTMLFGEMIVERMFGGSPQPGLLDYNHPDYVFVEPANPRIRRYEKEIYKSLNRVFIFMFCCCVSCLLLF